MMKKRLDFQHKMKNNAWNHFRTITHHRLLVMKGCFQVGLYRQGLLHDLSKYTWTEFKTGVRYYQGDRSPNAAEKEIMGYSPAWLHHKGRNKHHFEYWIDVSTREDNWRIVGVKMPVRYFVEMVMDLDRRIQDVPGQGVHGRGPICIFFTQQGCSDHAPGNQTGAG